MTDEKQEDVEIHQGAGNAAPLGADIAGPGTVRQGTGYSGTTSGGVDLGTGHDPSPDSPPAEGYMGDTTSSDDPPTEIIIAAEPNGGAR